MGIEDLLASKSIGYHDGMVVVKATDVKRVAVHAMNGTAGEADVVKAGDAVTVSLSALPAGTYVVKVNSASFKVTKNDRRTHYMKKMNMIKTAILSAACAANISIMAQDKPSCLTFCFDDRFVLNETTSLDGIDSISFSKTAMKRHKTSSAGLTMPYSKSYRNDGVYVFGDGERTLVKPSQYNGVDFTSGASQWCFQRSMESEHFVCFWEKGLELVNNTVSVNGHAASVVNLLNRAEKVWDVYVNELGFLIPGQSVTDKTKIALFIVNSSTWRADGSGQDGTAEVREMQCVKQGQEGHHRLRRGQ